MIRAALREEWRCVEEFGGLYEVSNLGGFRSLRSRAPVRPRLNPDGYLIVTVSIDGVRYTRKLHRLVAQAFHGDSRSALHNEVAHLDGNRANPRADNLKWVSKVENRSHRRLHGTECNGERHGAAKLTAAAVLEIRSFPKRQIVRRDLAAKYGISPKTVSSIREGKGWQHV